jgi:tetratricopeptide (TPR) repeat protein
MKTRLLLLAAAVVAIFAPASGVFAAESDALGVFASKAFLRGDFDNVVVDWCRFISENPDSPVAEFLLSSFGMIDDYATNMDLVGRTCEEALQKGVNNGLNEFLMKTRLKAYYEKKGLWKEADSLGVTDGWINDWLVLAPMGYRGVGASLHDAVLTPETEIDLSATYQSIEKPGKRVRWQTVPYKKPDIGVNVKRFLESRWGGCTYAFAQCETDRETDAVLLTMCGGSHKIWVNGREVLDADRRERAWVRGSLFAAVHLAKGWNRILLKLSEGSGGVSLYLCDASGKPLKGLKWEKELLLHDPGVGAVKTPQIAVPVDAYQYFKNLAAKEPESRLALLAYSLVARDERLAAEELEAMEKALALAPNDPFVNYFAGIMYESNELVPENKKKTLTLGCYKKAVAAEKEFALAHERIAQDYARDEKQKEAVAELDSILKFNPRFFHAHFLAINVLREWDPEVEGRWKKIEDIWPDSPAVLNHKSGFYSQHMNYAKREALEERIYSYDKRNEYFLSRKAQRYLEQGEDAKAIEIYRIRQERNPDSNDFASTMAGYCAVRGMYDNAIEYTRQIAVQFPESYGYLREIGELYHQQGAVDKAKEHYRKVLEMNPADIRLLRYVQFLDGVDENFAKSYFTSAEEAAKIRKNSPTQADYPKTSTITLLEEMVRIVYADGSNSAYERRITKVLDQKGVEEHLNEYVGGEVQDVKVIQPSGEVFEPLGLGGSGYTLHGLVPGSMIETYKRDDRGYGNEWEPGIEDITLHDPDKVTLKKRSVVIIDKNLQMEPPQERHFGPQIRASKSESADGRYMVYVWEAENMPRIVPEHMMPPSDEFLPRVFFLRKKDWSEITPAFRDVLFNYDIRPTKLLRDKTAEVIKGIPGQYEQAKAIYEYVMEQVRKPGGGGNAHVALESRTGSRETLFLSMLTIAGVKWDMARVSVDPALLGPVEWQYPDGGMFGSALIRVRPLGGPDVWVENLRIKRLPFGKLPPHIQNGIAFILGESGTTIERIPPERDADKADIITDVSVELGSMSGNASLTLPNSWSYSAKESFEEMPKTQQENVVSRISTQLFPGSTVKEDGFEFPDLKSSKTPFTIKWTMDVPNFLVRSKDGCRAKLGLMPLDLKEKFIRESTRKYPLVARFYQTVRDTVKIDLAGNYTVAKLSPGLVIMNDFGAYSLSITEENGAVYVKRSFNFSPVTVKPEDFNRFIEFCRAVDNAEQTELILEPINK